MKMNNNLLGDDSEDGWDSKREKRAFGSWKATILVLFKRCLGPASFPPKPTLMYFRISQDSWKERAFFDR